MAGEMTTEVEPREDLDAGVGDEVDPSTAAGGMESEGVDEGAPDSSAISEAMIGRAKDYGLSSDDLTGMNEERLGRMFSAIDRRIMQPQSVQGPTGPAMPSAVPTPVTAMPEQYAPLKLEFGDDLDESVVKPFQSVVDHLNGQLKEVHAFRQEARNELQAMNLLREFSDFDRFVTGLGDDWTADYGTGPTIDMDPQSAEFQKRMQVFHGARTLQSDALQRRQRISVNDSRMRSHHGIHWDRIAEHERNKLDGKIDRRRKGFSERPVKGKAPAMSPREEAIRAWNEQ